MIPLLVRVSVLLSSIPIAPLIVVPAGLVQVWLVSNVLHAAKAGCTGASTQAAEQAKAAHNVTRRTKRECN